MDKGFDDKKEKLVALGAESLAEALLEISAHSDMAEDIVKRLTTAPDETHKRFSQKLTELKRRKKFVRRYESSAFAHELEGLLGYLREGVSTPKTGVELAASFFEADDAVFETCDDSDGIIGDVFRHDARELFVYYAA